MNLEKNNMMNKIKNMTLLFDREWFERIHLYKDVGMIPIYLHNLYGLKTHIVFYDNTSNRDLNNIEFGVNLIRLKKIFFKKNKYLNKYFSPMTFYLIKNSKKIDILMLFHMKNINYFYRFIYKILNPKGKVYLKLDMDFRSINWIYNNYEYYNKNKNILFLKNGFIEYLKILRRSYRFKKWKKQLSRFDLVSCETKLICDQLNKYLNIDKNINLTTIPNGFSRIGIENIKIRNFEEKENLIITVGRIGSYQKNNEMLLNILKDINLKDWKVYFIGPIEDKFNIIIENFYKNNPLYKNKVIFYGPIINRNELFDYYNRSKVFCLTSRWESYGLVLNEALYFGNYIISTNVGIASEITKNGKIGSLIQEGDENTFKNELSKIICGENNISKYYNEIKDHCYNNYLWENIVKDLYSKLLL